MSHSDPVLVVGGGLVGLSAGLFLQHLGVPFVLVEKTVKGSILPRSRGIHTRTMELFRQVGVEEAVKAAASAAWVQGSFGGARRGRTMLEAEPLDHARGLEKMGGGDPSPTMFCACPQTMLEPVLRKPLAERGGDLRFGTELVAFVEEGDRVVATVRDTRGEETRIVASYLLAADGGRSFVRGRLGIGTVDTPALQHFVNLFFRADIAELVRGRTFSQCAIANDRVRGLFLSMNNATEWSFHLEYDPATSAPATLPDAELVSLVQAAIGADVPIELLHTSTWSTAVRIAERYRSGRVFLAGDAAHVMPPWGGFNGNTGIADAHNLAWRLAAALAGNPEWLDSYEKERRPVAVLNGEQAQLRTDFDARFGIPSPTNADAMARFQGIGALLTRHRYPDRAPVDELRAQTGTRFPHAWLRRGEAQISTLDLFGKDWVRLSGPDVGPDWTALTGLPTDGTVLVRPDGFVAERSDEPISPGEKLTGIVSVAPLPPAGASK